MRTLVLFVVLMISISVDAYAGDPPKTLDALLRATQVMVQLPGEPKFELMTTAQMKEDACVHPETCPALVSIHPPKTDRIIVNSDADIAHDLNAQAQIVHVIAMYLLEQDGRYSPDLPCSKVVQIEAFADVLSAQYLSAVMQEYLAAGLTTPPLLKLQVMMFCTPDGESHDWI